ncbi:MAG: polysaccharide biosynthesis/export family protein [Flavobacterium sp.]|jgi:polysaccharide export outer membrane protein
MIKIIRLIIFIIIPIIYTNCIPQKELIYLQDNGNQENESITINPINPYQVQINDILSINIKTIEPKFNNYFSVKDNSQNTIQNDQSLYFNGYTIDNHGKVRIPLIGDVLVLGLTLEEVRKKIETILLKEYFTKESGLFVDVKLSGIRVTINGEINSPGTKILYFDKINVLEAIANSGDITMLGNRKEVLVIRQTPIGTKTGQLDLTDKNVINSPFFYIQPNDYIYIKPLKQKSWGTGTTGIQSVTTVISVLSLATTLFVLFKNN